MAQEQHAVLGNGHEGSPQCSPTSSASPSHRHPLASDKQVRVLTIEPQRPQVSLQAAVLHSDHSPPGVHGGVVVGAGVVVVDVVVGVHGVP